MAGGAIDLGNVKRVGMPKLVLACSVCGRSETYDVAELIKMFGPGQGLPDLAAELSKDCGKRLSADPYDRCQFRYQNLG